MLLRDGELRAAADAYSEYLLRSARGAEESSRALFHLGVIYASPDTSLHSPQQSIAVLERLRREYPLSEYVSAATLLIELQSRSASVLQELEERRLEVGDLREELERQQSELFILQKRLGQKQGQIIELERRVLELEAEIAGLRQDLALRQRELEQLDRLKEIDLQAPPPLPRR